MRPSSEISQLSARPGHQRDAVRADLHELVVDAHEIPDIDVAIVGHRIEVVRVLGAAEAKRAARRGVGEIGLDSGDRRAADGDRDGVLRLILRSGAIGAEDRVGGRERQAERKRPADERAPADGSLMDLAREGRQLRGAVKTWNASRSSSTYGANALCSTSVGRRLVLVKRPIAASWPENFVGILSRLRGHVNRRGPPRSVHRRPPCWRQRRFSLSRTEVVTTVEAPPAIGDASRSLADRRARPPGLHPLARACR